MIKLWGGLLYFSAKLYLQLLHLITSLRFSITLYGYGDIPVLPDTVTSPVVPHRSYSATVYRNISWHNS